MMAADNLLVVCVDKPILKREKIRIGYDGEICAHNIFLPQSQIVGSGVQ